MTQNNQNDDVSFDDDDDNQSHQSTSASSSSSTLRDHKPSPNFRLRRPISGDACASQSSQTENLSSLNHRGRSFNPRRSPHPPEQQPPTTDQKDDDVSTVTTAEKNDDRVTDSANSAESATQLGDDSSLNSLVFFSGLLIKSITFQINLIISIVKFPIWALLNLHTLIFNPQLIVTRGRAVVTSQLTNLPALRFGWGLIWAVYVGCLLCGVLLSSVVFSEVFTRYIVSEPLRMKEVLNFDYSKASPVAYVPLAGVGCYEDIGYRVIPAGHKLAASVRFVLPESEYNRNLGMFTWSLTDR